MAGVDFCVWFCVLVGILRSGALRGNLVAPCDVPADSAERPEANKSPLRFTISDIKSDPAIAFPAVSVESHLYTVRHCFMTLYVLSSTAPKNPFLDAVTISGTPLSCKSLDRNPSQVSGTVLRYFDDSISRPEDVPVSWYQGDRMVIGIKFFQFPQSPSLKLRCGVTRSTDLGDIKIFADVTTKKVGCPRTRWGTQCQQVCPCQNGGVCHTFDGTCSCPDPYAGVRCEIDLASTASTEGSVNTTGSSSAIMSTTTQVPSNNSTATPKKGVLASGSFTDDINSSSHPIVGVTLHICNVIILWNLN